MDRRTLLFSLAAATGVARALAAERQLETFSEWLAAPAEARAAALQHAVEHIRSADASIHAWVQVSPQKPLGPGPLAGIPFGVKDIIETNGLATEYGSPIYKGRIGTEDAAIVVDLRRRGGVMMGKTQTTSFAYRTPAPTRNPRNLDHTPGGSSSGSAAAVAAGMVPFALGTQTGGSVLRPASFCGVTGFKPTFGVLPMGGVLPFAKSLDTLGLFTHTPADMRALWEATGHTTGTATRVVFGVPDPMVDVEPPMADAFQRALSALRAGGATLRSIDVAPMLTRLVAASRTVMFYEGARFHEERYRQYGDRMAEMGELVREGLQISAAAYDAARREIDDAKSRVSALHATTPIILVPAATGPAPRGLQSTGDSRMNAPWTALGVPAISIPLPVGAALPLGLQLTAARGDDPRLLQAAVQVHRLLHPPAVHG
jgi:Asp-tRNA(Asn)/Glu-tRNA(Gln) amidotransferase A subunit family amidase